MCPLSLPSGSHRDCRKSLEIQRYGAQGLQSVKLIKISDWAEALCMKALLSFVPYCLLCEYSHTCMAATPQLAQPALSGKTKK